MATRKPRNPLVSLVMFLALAGVAYAAYDNRDKIKGIFGESEVVKLGPEKCEEMVEYVEETFEGHREFEGVRGRMAWRPSSKYYRLEILVTGDSDPEAKALCEKICKRLTDRIGAPVSVWAYDGADRNTAKALP